MPDHPLRSAQARARREHLVAFARTNVGLEGFTPTPATEALWAEYVAGRLTIHDVIARLKEGANGSRA